MYGSDVIYIIGVGCGGVCYFGNKVVYDNVGCGVNVFSM